MEIGRSVVSLEILMGQRRHNSLLRSERVAWFHATSICSNSIPLRRIRSSRSATICSSGIRSCALEKVFLLAATMRYKRAPSPPLCPPHFVPALCLLVYPSHLLLLAS